MEINEIQKRIDKMPSAMSAKGLVEPEAEFILEANAQSHVRLHWYKDAAARKGYNPSYQYIRQGSIARKLDDADLFIANLPSRKEAQFQEFMTALGGVIDLGKSNGIEVEFLNPLSATMKKLSENALTDQRAKVGG